MKRTAIIGVASACLIALGGAALAANRFVHRDPEHAYAFISRKVDPMMDDIHATDAQRAQINQIKDKLFKEGMDLKQSQGNLRQQFFANLDAPQVNANDVHARVDKQLDAFRAFAHDVADASIQIHDLLTPEQRAQLKQEISKHHDRAHGMQPSDEQQQ